MVSAGIRKNLQCCVRFTILNGIANIEKFPFRKPRSYTYAPIGSGITIGKIIWHQTEKPCPVNFPILLRQYFVCIKKRSAPIRNTASSYGENVWSFIDNQFIEKFLNLYGKSQVMQRKNKSDTIRCYGEILFSQFLRDRANFYVWQLRLNKSCCI